MNELSQYLVNQLLLEETELHNFVVVYSGRFQPFHKGHYATYHNLCNKFGKDRVYIGTSNKTDNQKSPFNFKEKKIIMTKMFGIPSNKIVEVKNPYAPTEILEDFDENTTGFITVVGEKDEMRLGGKYFEKYKGKIEHGYKDKGYIYVAPSQSNPISGTNVRNWLSKGDEEQQRAGFLKAYPKFDEKIFKLITLKLKNMSEGMPGGVGVGLSFPNGTINGAPKPEDVKKTRKELDKEDGINEAKWEEDTYTKCMLDKLPLSLNIVKKLVDPIRTISLHATDVDNLSNVVALQGTKKSISTFNKTSKYGKLVQGNGMHTKGGIIVALSGVVLAQSIMDLWTEPDKQGRRWVEPGTVIDGLGRERDVVFNFAPELKKYKENWKEHSFDGTITNAEKAEFIKKYYDAAEKFMLSKKKEFQDKYLNSNGLYYDSDWNEVVLTDIKIEKILAIPSNWSDDEVENEKTLKQLKQKYKNVEVADKESEIQNFIKQNGGTIKESVNEDITLDVNIGDTILMGKFKNKKVVVKSIGKDEHGMPTINGKKVATFRILPKVNIFKEVAFANGNDDSQPDGGYLPKGKARVLGGDDGVNKSDEWFVRGGYVQTDFPKADAIYAKDDENQYSFKIQSKNNARNLNKPTTYPLGFDDVDVTQEIEKIQKAEKRLTKKSKQKPKPTDTIAELISDYSDLLDSLFESNEDDDKQTKEGSVPSGANGSFGNYAFFDYTPIKKKKLDNKKANFNLKDSGQTDLEDESDIEEIAVQTDNIPGGLAKGKTLIDLAKKWDTKGYYDPNQFAKEYIKPKLLQGIKVEMEHTSDVRYATEIAMDHLWEDLNYYDKLKKVETSEASIPQNFNVSSSDYHSIAPIKKRKLDNMKANFPTKNSGQTDLEDEKEEDIEEIGVGTGEHGIRMKYPAGDKLSDRMKDVEQARTHSDSNKEYQYNPINEVKAQSVVNYYKAVCKKLNITPLPIKFGPVGRAGAATTFNPKTFVPEYISFDLNRIIDIERAVLHEITHQILLVKQQNPYHNCNKSAGFKKVENKLIDKFFYSSESKILRESLLKEITKGLFGGTIKINGELVKVEVELVGVDNVKKVFIVKVINIDKKYWNRLPSNGILEIPARIFRTPGGGWYKIKHTAFEGTISEISAMGDGFYGSFQNDGNSTTGYAWNADWDDYDDQNYYLDNLPGWTSVSKKPSEYERKKATDQALPIDNHSDGKTSKYNRILKQNFKEPVEFLKTADIKLTESSANDIIKDLDKVKNDLLKKVDTLVAKKKKLYSNVDIESPMSADEKKLDKDIADLFSQINQLVLQKRKIKESINESLLMEGGAYGHMNHPFDTEINLTFGQLKDIVNRALDGNLELSREKTDGQALAISWVGGRLVAARNKGHLANRGANALDINAVADKFAGRGELEKAYNFAMQDLTKAIKSLSDSQKEKIFKDGACFMNLEVIYPTSVNVIPYGQPLLVFHGTMEYNESGEAIGEDPQAGKILAGMVKQINQDVQDNYTIQGPPVLELPKSEDLSSKKPKYLAEISKLQKEFGLGDTAGVAEYHQAWWENFIDKKSPTTLDNNTKIGLVKRWAFGEKGFRIDKNTITDEKTLAWAQKIDKEDHKNITKENLMKFENIFLGVGADVLSFTSSVLTVNPDSAVREMKKRLDQTIKDVEASGDPKKIEKLKLELKRLSAIGGPSKIVPIEGIVFVYNGQTFKLTGAFASLNQLLGIFY